jgi:hypothetical protein
MTSYQLAVFVIVTLQPAVDGAVTLSVVLRLVSHLQSQYCCLCQGVFNLPFPRFGSDVFEDPVLLVHDVGSSNSLDPEEEGTPFLRNA